MAKVRFVEDFDYKPTRSCTIAYTAGWSGTVKRDCANKAIAARKAVALPGNTKNEGGGDGGGTVGR